MVHHTYLSEESGDRRTDTAGAGSIEEFVIK